MLTPMQCPGGSWAYIILEIVCFYSVTSLKAVYTTKRHVCRHKGNNLPGASQSMTLSAPFQNHTSSLALILTPPSAEQITPLLFHNSGRLLSRLGYGAVSSFLENGVNHCGIALRQKSFFCSFLFNITSTDCPCCLHFHFTVWWYVWQSLDEVY